MKIRRALISVSDKAGVLELAQGLRRARVEIVSTGGTAKLLNTNGVAVTEISEVTGFPEMMDGRVKTLHPLVHGGILGRRGVDDAVMEQHGIPAIDLVVVNLYPFQQVTAPTDCDLGTAIENIDIGGPTMIRAAAKNFRDVAVVVDVADYAEVMDQLESDGGIDLGTRYALALKAFAHTARYDGTIANYLGAVDVSGVKEPFADTINLQFKKTQALRYGENPHQGAAFYIDHQAPAGSIAAAAQLQGKQLSYNNIADTDAALECVKQFDEPACVIVKHANPCGVAVAHSAHAAYEQAYRTDPESAFGGIIAFNVALTQSAAQQILDNQFVEVIVAPEIEPAAEAALSAKQNVRVLVYGGATEGGRPLDFKRVNGGLLVQDWDGELYADLNTVTRRQPDTGQMDDLLFAWRVAKFVKSNAIVYARDRMTVGVGAGQMSRVNSARIAAIKAEHAGLEVDGAVMASDAFFPFRDAIDAAARAGVTSIIQPGGSMRDEEVIAACDEHDIAMMFTGMRHFRH